MKSPSDILTMKELIEKPIRDTFLAVMTNELDNIEAQMQARVTKLIEEQKATAKKVAAKMAIDMVQKLDSDTYSIEFKI